MLAMRPPHIRDLLEDPVFRAYMKTTPWLPPNLRHGNPWAVWALTLSGKWRGGQFPTYADAWRVTVKAVRNPGYKDVALISRRFLFPDPPPGFYVARYGVDTQWCGRCRRPSTFSRWYGAHITRSMTALTEDEDDRCYHCAARRIFATSRA